MLRNNYALTSRGLLHVTSLLTAFILIFSILAIFPSPAKADGEADLIVQEITFSPEEPKLGETVTITVNIRNQGSGEAVSSYVVCYVDADIIDTEHIEALGPGMMTTTNFQWTAENGPHTIKAVADSSEIISESNETNNSKSYTLTPLAADLTVESISWTPTSCSPGDQVTLSVQMKNIGNTYSEVSTLDFFIDNSSRGIHDIPRIYPGETHTETYSWIALTGQHSLKAFVDNALRIPESDESNNQKTVTFSTEAPDLVIQKISYTPLTPSKDDVATITVTIKNQGTGRADTSHLGYSIDEEMMIPLSIPELYAASSVNLTINWNVLSNTHVFNFIADYYDRLVEIDENNNEDDLEITAMIPDLTITNITWEPEDVAVGDIVTFTVSVENLGLGRSDSTEIATYIDGKFQEYISVPSLDSEDTYKGTFTWEATPGSHKTRAYIDHDNLLKEVNESNNLVDELLTVTLPDIKITDISWTPENPNVGDTVTFTITVNNTGPGKVDNFHLAYYLNDELLTSVPVNSLLAEESAKKTYTWKSLRGRHTFKAVADFNNYVFENNENNNFYEVTVVPNMADLVIHAVRWDQASVTPGEDVVFSVDIKNTGTQITAPSRVSYFVDGTAMGYTDINPVQPDEIITEKFTWPASDNYHEIEIIADFTNLIEEIDEDNNSRIITLPPPDIIVDNISWAPEDASIGDTITFTVTIRNSGESVTQPSTATCSVDGENPVTLEFPDIPAGTTVSETFDWIAMKGGHSLTVIADVNNTTTETNETNNSKTISFSTLTPDLSVGDITWKMENPLVLNEVLFSVNIVNEGSDIADYSVLNYSFDGHTPVRKELTAIPAGETEVITFKVILESGPHDLVIKLDIDDTVTELDEANNVKTYAFNSSAPDLIIRSITWSPETATAGDNITITAAVENRGKNIAENVLAIINIDDVKVGEISFDRIGVGERLSGDINWTLEAGLHEISVFADYGETIIESDETNNSYSRTISLGGPTTTTKTQDTQLPVINNIPDKGILADSWLYIILAAIILGGSSFYLLFRAFKKD